MLKSRLYQVIRFSWLFEMKTTIREIQKSDINSLMELLNFYVQHTNNSFASHEYTYNSVMELLNASRHLPKFVVESSGKVVGFGMAYPFRPENTFSNTVKFTYWIDTEFTGRGIGKKLYIELESSCKLLGVENILVNISSDNVGSIHFHEKHGFIKCGEFKEIGIKFNKKFSMIWMQKQI